MLNKLNMEELELVSCLLEQYLREKIENNQIIAYSLIKKYKKPIGNREQDRGQEKQRTLNRKHGNSKVSHHSYIPSEQQKEQRQFKLPPEVLDDNFQDRVLERLILIQKKVNSLKSQKRKQKRGQDQLEIGYNKMDDNIGKQKEKQSKNKQIRRAISYKNFMNEEDHGQKQLIAANQQRYIVSIKPVLQIRKENLGDLKQNSIFKEKDPDQKFRKERRSEKIYEKPLISSRTMTYLPMTLQQRKQITGDRFERDSNFRQLQKSNKKRVQHLQRNNRNIEN